jgi:metal-responsive CopG/Arc/MetJ family transcriptional regulator
MSARINISIPDNLKAEIDDYNHNNPYTKINISKIAQSAIDEKLKEMKLVSKQCFRCNA